MQIMYKRLSKGAKGVNKKTAFATRDLSYNIE
jgi:hypothetical protein